MSEFVDWTDGDVDLAPMPTTAQMNLGTVTRMLGALRRLHRHVGEYDALHVAEVARLGEMRERHVGPMVRRIRQIEVALEQFAAKRFAEEDVAKTVTPNGTIAASRKLQVPLTVDDEKAAKWVFETWENFMPVHTDNPVKYQAKVHVKELRQLLEVLEAKGVVERAVKGPAGVRVLAAGERWPRAFEPAMTGVFLAHYGLDQTDHPPADEVPGLRWEPAGYLGLGRTFTVDLT